MDYEKTANIAGIFATSRLVTFSLYAADTMRVDSRKVTVINQLGYLCVTTNMWAAGV